LARDDVADRGSFCQDLQHNNHGNASSPTTDLWAKQHSKAAWNIYAITYCTKAIAARASHKENFSHYGEESRGVDREYEE